MITEDYVSFETAKLLKEKGFDECTLFSYDKNGDNKDALRPFLESEGDVRRPTLQMAMKWLREVHNIDISIEVRVWNEVEDGFVKYWKYTVYRTDEIEDFGQSNTPEEAAEDAINYCLENLI